MRRLGDKERLWPNFDPMTILMVGAMAASTGMGALGQIQAGNAAKRTADANAEIANANAGIALQDAAAKQESAKYEGLKISHEKNAVLDTQKALYGASGLDISSGTPLDVMAKTASEYSRDIGMTGIAANNAMVRGENEASIYRMQGENYRQSGADAVTAGWLGAGSTLLTGFGKGAYMYGSYGKGK